MSDRTQTLTFKTQVHFHRAEKGATEMRRGEAPALPPAPTGRVPKIARLMALAIRFDRLLARGEVKDYAELARLGHVTRARVTQIMNMLQLAPDIQEQILFLPEVEEGRDPVKEWQVRPVAAEVEWCRQRGMWRTLMRRRPRSVPVYDVWPCPARTPSSTTPCPAIGPDAGGTMSGASRR